MLIEINPRDVEIFLDKYDFSLILFKTPNCRICASLSYLLEELEEELDFALKVGVLDVTKDETILNTFNLTSIPTLLLKHFNQREFRSGSMSLEELLIWTNKYLT